MTLVYDLDAIAKNNGGKLPPLPYMPIMGYTGGFALMLSDGEHEGFYFPGYESKADAIAEANADKVPGGWHLYLLKANGHDSRNPSHIYWGLRAEFID